MTDHEKLKALFDEWGVGYKEDTDKENNPYIRCEEGKEKIGGYYMFFTDFEFTSDGKFIKMGAWE